MRKKSFSGRIDWDLATVLRAWTQFRAMDVGLVHRSQKAILAPIWASSVRGDEDAVTELSISAELWLCMRDSESPLVGLQTNKSDNIM